MIENDFAFLARLQFLCALTVLDDGENLAAIRASLTVALEIGFRQFLIDGIRGLLSRALPGSASTGLLLGHGNVESALIKCQSGVAYGILDEVERHAERIVKLKCICSLVYGTFRSFVAEALDLTFSVPPVFSLFSRFRKRL